MSIYVLKIYLPPYSHVLSAFYLGAAMVPTAKDASWAMRDTGMLVEFNGNQAAYEIATEILAKKHYKDATKLQGYYNHMNPIGNPNWRKYYFGDNYARLSQIKAKFDPLNVFGNPRQVEPAIQ